ncbi:protein phosphatase Slingshot homolog 2-like isoform X2 [Corticium candelabrum]|nr:protein phosphatase Slingshot homolog 2-like isoform X2 [Corticium candelabrum]
MSLLTVERASPSEGSASESDLLDADDPQAEERSKCSSVEGFLATKSIAVGLGHRMQWRLNSSQYQGEGYAHLRALVQLICPPDECKLAVELESRLSFRRYFVMVARIGVQDTEESAILGVDWVEGSRLRVGLVFPIWRDVHVVLDGDGGFSVSSGSRTHTFKPVSVQCMWAAFQALHKACENARRYNYYPAAGSLSHTWIGYYLSEMTNEVVSLNEWNIMNDLQSDRPETPPLDPRQLVKPSEKEIIKQAIYVKLKDVMMRVDLESITSKEVRERLQIVMEMDLRSYKSFIDEQIIRIFGQMENPSQILEHLYLGSEWNASNLEELKELGIGHILNISREIDNFFPPEFKYKNIRVFDDEHADLLRHWDDTFRFIHTAKLEGSKVLVHCKMGISRSASTVIAYLMKEKKWDLDVALSFVKECRSIINPNANFRKQLKEYEGIISARYNPHWGQMAPQQFRKRHHSEAYLLDLYQQHFGESAMEKVASDDQPMDDGEEHDHMTLQVQHTLTKEEVRKSWCSGMDVDSYELEGQYLQQTKASRLTEYLSSLEKAEVPSYEGLQEFSFSSISMEEAQVFRRAGSLSPSALTGACGRGTPSAKRMRRVTSSPIEPFFSHAATTQPSTLDYAQSKIEISTESELDEHTNIE